MRWPEAGCAGLAVPGHVTSKVRQAPVVDFRPALSAVRADPAQNEPGQTAAVRGDLAGEDQDNRVFPIGPHEEWFGAGGRIPLRARQVKEHFLGEVAAAAVKKQTPFVGSSRIDSEEKAIIGVGRCAENNAKAVHSRLDAIHAERGVDGTNLHRETFENRVYR